MSEEKKEQEAEQPKEHVYYTSDEAMEKAKALGIDVTLATLLTWVGRKKLGFQPGGPGSRWLIFREKFDKFITGGVIERGDNGTDNGTKHS